MKQILIFLISFLYTVSTYAECSNDGLWIFPNGKTIKQNTIFIVDGYADSQEIVLGLNQKYNVYLKSGEKKIKLLVTEICFGQFYMTQAILKPETELEPDLEYVVYIDHDILRKDNNELASYKVVAEKDTQKPKLSSKPKELQKTLVQYGCGPSIHVVFSNPAEDESEIIVRTTVKNLKTGKETTYYIQPDGDKIKIGHGMCSGAFSFDENEHYEVEFSFVDTSGNLTHWVGSRIKFTKPITPTNHE